MAYEKTKAIANQRKEMENVLGHLELLSDEAVAALTQQLQQSNAQYEKLSAEQRFSRNNSNGLNNNID